MIPAGVEIFVGTTPIDMRWGFERLSGIVETELGRRARSGALFVFFGRRAHTVKMLFFDGTGLWLLYKRLDSGVFQKLTAHDPNARAIIVSEAVLEGLLEGVATSTKERKRVH